jgi:hypothetical protein
MGYLLKLHPEYTNHYKRTKFHQTRSQMGSADNLAPYDQATKNLAMGKNVVYEKINSNNSPAAK